MTETAADPTTDAEQVALTLAQEADAFVIRTDADMESVGSFLRTRVKAALKALDEFFDPMVAAAHKAHKIAVEKKNAAKAPALAAEAKLKRLLADYDAKRRAEIEAERVRMEAEARERAENERLAQAEALEAAGHREAASEVLDAPVVVPPPPPPVARTAPKGVGISHVWRFRIKDANAVNRAFLCPNEGAIAAVVKSQGKAAESMVGGIEVYQDSIVSSRAS